ncbi:MAG: Mur ligase family protein, partial [Candidatus Diapherotrites archaeon]|nr:Mur ligase family protein [Candidatus Diapherotrites archaeon]
ESVLRAAGYRTGLYTSPHLARINERFKVGGKEIPGKKLIKLISELRKIKEKNKLRLTHFEFTTALAFRYFAEQRVDFAVIETGMGGRLDATNVIVPRVSVITNIEKEHAQYLGSTLSKIAREKAGIIKAGVPVVTAEKKKKILGIFQNIAKKKKSKIVVARKPFAGKLRLLGSFQRINAAVALAAVRELQSQGIKINEKAVREGLASAKWSGRFDIVRRNPAVVLDCCHTPGAAKACAGAFRDAFPRRKAVLVIGVSSDKDIGGIAGALAPLAGSVVATEAKIRAMPAEGVKKEFEKRGKNVIVVSGVKKAVKKGVSITGKKGVVLVAGSCFVAGEALPLFKKLF